MNLFYPFKYSIFSHTPNKRAQIMKAPAHIFSLYLQKFLLSNSILDVLNGRIFLPNVYLNSKYKFSRTFSLTTCVSYTSGEEKFLICFEESCKGFLTDAHPVHQKVFQAMQEKFLFETFLHNLSITLKSTFSTLPIFRKNTYFMWRMSAHFESDLVPDRQMQKLCRSLGTK